MTVCYRNRPINGFSRSWAGWNRIALRHINPCICQIGRIRSGTLCHYSRFNNINDITELLLICLFLLFVSFIFLFYCLMVSLSFISFILYKFANYPWERHTPVQEILLQKISFSRCAFIEGKLFKLVSKHSKKSNHVKTVTLLNKSGLLGEFSHIFWFTKIYSCWHLQNQHR